VGETLSALWNLWRDAASFLHFPPLSFAALTVGNRHPPDYRSGSVPMVTTLEMGKG